MNDIAVDIEEIKNLLRQLVKEKVVQTVQLSPEILDPILRKSFPLGRPPTESEIRGSVNKFKTMKEAAEYLGIGVKTLSQYARLYDSYNQEDPAQPKLWRPTRGRKAGGSHSEAGNVPQTGLS